MDTDTDTQQEKPYIPTKFFCIELYDKVTRGNFLSFLYVSFATILFFVFIDASLSFVLTNYLHVPSDKSGTALGTIVFWNEIVIILFSAFWGILSDKIGRRWVYTIGAIFMTVGLFLPPFAKSFGMLLFFRIIFSPGAAATSSMLVALLADYPRDDGVNKARGKASGFMGLFAGLGAITALFCFLRIPSLLPNMSTQEAGKVMFIAIGILGVITVVISFFGLQKQERTDVHTHQNFFQIIMGGLRATSNPIIVLSYISSFAARGDSVIVSSFLSTFIQNYGIKIGIDPKVALNRAGEVSGIVQTFALVAAPFIGFLADKINRVFLMFVVAILSCVGYAMFGLITDPYNWSFPLILATVTVGVGEMGILVMCQSLLAQNAPETERGSVSGFFALTGSIGILIATSVGGYLFDNWREGAPFIIFSGFNGVVVIYSFILMIYQLSKGTFGGFIYKKQLPYNLVDSSEQPQIGVNNNDSQKKY